MRPCRVGPGGDDRGKGPVLCPELAEQGLDPLPGYLPTAEAGDPVLAERFPLVLITPAQRFFLKIRLFHQPMRKAAHQIKMRTTALKAARPKPYLI